MTFYRVFDSRGFCVLSLEGGAAEEKGRSNC